MKNWIPKFHRQERYTPWGKQVHSWWEWRGHIYLDTWEHI